MNGRFFPGFNHILVPLLLALTLLSGCSKSPREQYRAEMNAKLAVLYSSLQTFGGTNDADTHKRFTYNKDHYDALDDTTEMRSVPAIEAAESLRDHFDQVPLSVITQPLKGFDSWCQQMECDYTNWVPRIMAELDRIQEDFTVHPDHYELTYKPLGALGPTFTASYEERKAVSLYRKDGDLCFAREEGNGFRLYRIDKAIEIDFPLWTEEVRKLMARASTSPSGVGAASRTNTAEKKKTPPVRVAPPAPPASPP